jgi:hypothetical protein
MRWFFFSVWILGHVLTGWDGTNGLANPTNLCMLYVYFIKQS